MAQQTESPLFDLPPELRNTIYELTLMGSTTLVGLREDDDSVLIELPCLLRSCKQIYVEAILVFYHLTPFYSRYAYNIVCWLKALHPRYRKAISEIRLETNKQQWVLHTPRIRVASNEDEPAVLYI
ncbi:hypothetical protein LTR85_009792 [Meristemomyces frigidus]|nr:hypothetical protein LTR85_009792 [Meristemomyces frigidus]